MKKLNTYLTFLIGKSHLLRILINADDIRSNSKDFHQQSFLNGLSNGYVKGLSFGVNIMMIMGLIIIGLLITIITVL